MIAIGIATLLANPANGPELPPGSNAWFQESAVSVMRDLEAGRFAQAVAKAKRLPDATITVEWKDGNLTQAQRLEFAAARDRAFTAWREAYEGLNLRLVPKDGEVQVSFVSQLPPNADTAGPAGAVFLFSQAAADPTVDAVFALRRGASRVPAAERDIFNETVFAIGSHLGLARVPVPGMPMFRTEEIYGETQRPQVFTATQARRNVELANQLRQAAARKTRLRPTLPTLQMEPLRFQAPTVLQGQPITFTVQLTNRGTAPLKYQVVPDCGCFVIRPGQQVAPGDTIAIPVGIDTTSFPGKHTKHLVFYTNDPEAPVRQLPVTFEARPRYRFLWNEPTPFLQMDENGRAASVFLVSEGEPALKIRRVAVTGAVSGMASFEPWEGEMADPEMGEPSRKRKGYRIDVLFPPASLAGRAPVSLEILTDDPKFGQLAFPFFLQRGIVALPQNLYLGEIRPGASARGFALVSRPGQPFKVTKVETSSARLAASVEPVPGRAEFRVLVTYRGAPSAADLNETVRIHTDDPKQPVIEIRVTARARG